MPQQDSHSRAVRRQSGRGNTVTPPGKRDPMTAVYIGVAVLVIAIVAIFGFVRWQQNRDIAAAWATPTPAPSSSATPRPVLIQDLQKIGKPMIAYGDGKNGSDTPSGGHGQVVDGITCGAEYATLHIHPHLAIFYNGTQVEVPRLIGGALGKEAGPEGCLYWLHTHGDDGIIHIEAPQIHPPAGGDYTLGQFFDIWGQPLTRTNVAGLKGPVTVYLNGAKYDGDLESIALKSHENITLEVGAPLVPPPNYQLPPND